MEKKIKLLILTNKIMSYRIPIFNRLSCLYDLTVAYSLGNFEKDQSISFCVQKLPYIAFKRFVIQKVDVYSYASQFDVVIYTGDIAWLKYSTLPFRKSTFKTIVWSIGVSASYDKPYDSVTRWDFLRDFFYKKADAILFYSDYPIDKYVSRGFDRRKLFVAPNTVAVYNSDCKYTKDSYLFIGSLYKQKGIFSLLDAYLKVYKNNSNIPDLNIVGNGEEMDNICRFLKSNKLESKVHLLGAVYDEVEKEKLFKKAFVCISPSQAGLGVLECMAHGTPFVTNRNAITGGERFNIVDKKTGFFIDSQEDLCTILKDVIYRPQYYEQVGMNAALYYKNNRTPEIMCQGFIDAINFVL